MATRSSSQGQTVPDPDSGQVVKTVERLIGSAVKARASDIHLEPKPDCLSVRLRIDGVLVEQKPVSKEMALALVSRIKVLGGMDIAEKRMPQDGNFPIDFGKNGTVSVRASTFPCMDGEKVVLRLIRGGKIIPLDKTGLSKQQAQQVQKLTRRPFGLILVTGPTGSGKTTTLYAMLGSVNTKERNVVTLEDPVETRLPHVTQGQVNPKAGFSFASGLRAILRQDPDVILVGELRDTETATIALQASMTGHLVLGTLHTNSTVDSIARLIDMGLDPFIVANALIGVVSQRLIRTVCRHCAEPYSLNEDVTQQVGFALPKGSRLLAARGCSECGPTGYKGRTGVFEVLEMNDELSQLIRQRADVVDFKKILQRDKIVTMRRHGMQLALQGITTPNEVLRLT
jgi:general secretion pathway protein E/type IV pilus assembly protein PilB